LAKYLMTSGSESQIQNRIPSVSVIIPARNVENFLPGCIAAVRANKFQPDRVQIIVVENGSSDSSFKIAEKFADKVISFPDLSIGALRNRGAEVASGEILAFLDADCLADPLWLYHGTRTVLERECIGGSLYDVPEDAGWIEKDWFCQRSPGVIEVTHTGGGNLFITADLFAKAGGFDENLVTGEDYEFCARVRKIAPVISDDRIRTIHLGNPKTLYQFLRREIWYGLGAFGSFRISLFDKPVIGTLIFAIAILIQLVALVGILFGLALFSWFLVATGAVVVLLLATLYYRRRYLNGVRHFFSLSLMYYLYYLGRSISLLYILMGRSFYHNIKASN